MEIGNRIAVEGSLATILFKGHIKNDEKNFLWLGLEWDLQSRGKHNGLHNGYQYFKTKNNRNSASFLNSNSKKISIGRDFIQILVEKYLPNEKDVDQIKLSLGDSKQKVFVETVGWEKIEEKQANFFNIKEVGLANYLISFSTLSYQTRSNTIINFDYFVNIQDLDLSKNLFDCWDIVAFVCGKLPNLASLRLNYNRFSEIDSSILYQTEFTNVKILSLNSTLITWSQILYLEKSFQKLEELHLESNELDYLEETCKEIHSVSNTSQNESNLNPFPTKFQNLKLLNLGNNNISSTSISKSVIPNLQSLQRLFLNNNPAISTIPTPSADLTHYFFNNLIFINLNQTNLSSWQSLDLLNNFPSLTEYRINNIPIITSLTQNASTLLKARLKTVSVLNGSSVSKKDKQDAEIWYLNHCNNTKTETTNLVEFRKMHPRFEELCLEFGKPSTVPIEFLSKNLKDRLVVLKLCGGGVENGYVEKRIPPGITVRSFKMICCRVLGMEMPVMCEVVGGGGVMGDDLREVGFYSVKSGDVILITKI